MDKDTKDKFNSGASIKKKEEINLERTYYDCKDSKQVVCVLSKRRYGKKKYYNKNI